MCKCSCVLFEREERERGYIDESRTVFVVEEDVFWLTLLGEVPFLVRRALKN